VAVEAERLARVVAGQRAEILQPSAPRGAECAHRGARVRGADNFAEVVDAARRAVVATGEDRQPLDGARADDERTMARPGQRPAGDFVGVAQTAQHDAGALFERAEIDDCVRTRLSADGRGEQADAHRHGNGRRQ
jgi:hypothetical protein